MLERLGSVGFIGHGGVADRRRQPVCDRANTRDGWWDGDAVIDKFVATTADAVAGIADGSTVLLAGFGAGTPEHLVAGLIRKAPKDWKEYHFAQLHDRQGS